MRIPYDKPTNRLHTINEPSQRRARRVFREWALRPGPVWTFLKEMRHRETLGQLLHTEGRDLSWIGERA